MGSPGLAMYLMGSLKSQAVFLPFSSLPSWAYSCCSYGLKIVAAFPDIASVFQPEVGGAKDKSYANWACWSLLNWWYSKFLGFPGGTVVKNPPVTAEDQETEVWSLVQEDPLEEGMATCSSILAWRGPWTEEPGGLQSIGSQSVGHSWVTLFTFTQCVQKLTSC